MNIQPSIMVWTVICFLLLCVILKNLLFEPVLKVIDSRKEKTAAAKERKREIENLVSEHALQLEKEKLLAEERNRKSENDLAVESKQTKKRRMSLLFSMVENNGFEPMTPCLQSRCSRS